MQQNRGPVLVTGANGFIGRHVARTFARQGSQVFGIGHGAWAAEDWQAWGLSDWHEADVTVQSLEDFALEPSVIVHCAGSGSVAFSIQHPLADFERTVAATANVMEYARLNVPSCRIVYPSSASVYGTVQTVPIFEDSSPAPISQYGTHKLMAEQMVNSYGRQFGMAVSIVRLFSVYGCGLRKQLLWDACCKFSEGDCTFMGTGEEVRDWLHVEDAATLLLAAAENASPECPTVNGGSGEGVTVREILHHLGGKLPLNATPVFSGAQRTGDPSRYVAGIVQSLAWGWQPRHSWQDGVAEYAAWWRAERA